MWILTHEPGVFAGLFVMVPLRVKLGYTMANADLQLI